MMARAGEAAAAALRDYTCVLVKREHLGGRLGEAEHFTLKVRQQPASIYVYCQGPNLARGTEVLYVAGRNGNQALVHQGGLQGRLPSVVRSASATSLPLNDAHLLPGSRRSLNEWGLEPLAKEIVVAYDYEQRYGETEVKLFRGAKVEERDCYCIQVTHPTQRRSFRYHMTRAYFDSQLQLPIRWETYTWPTRAGEPPVLLEELTYRKLRTNVGLTDADFDPRNPAYKFRG
jgi:hypothetical protein